MLNGKKILFATGGTGGHINPALAVAGYIRENYPKAEILFVGTADRMEAQLVPAAGYDFKTIEIQGFSRELNFEGLKHNIKTVNLLFKSEGQAKKIIEDFKPDVVIGFGGYVSGPVLSVAATSPARWCAAPPRRASRPPSTSRTLSPALQTKISQKRLTL